MIPMLLTFRCVLCALLRLPIDHVTEYHHIPRGHPSRSAFERQRFVGSLTYESRLKPMHLTQRRISTERVVARHAGSPLYQHSAPISGCRPRDLTALSFHCDHCWIPTQGAVGSFHTHLTQGPLKGVGLGATWNALAPATLLAFNAHFNLSFNLSFHHADSNRVVGSR